MFSQGSSCPTNHIFQKILTNCSLDILVIKKVGTYYRCAGKLRILKEMSFEFNDPPCSCVPLNKSLISVSCVDIAMLVKYP